MVTDNNMAGRRLQSIESERNTAQAGDSGELWHDILVITETWKWLHTLSCHD